MRCAERPGRALAALALLVAFAQPAAAEPAAAPSAQPQSSARVLDGIVAVVDGDPISLRELKRYGIEGAPFLPPDVRADYRMLLDSMIERRLLKAEFEKNGIQAPDAMVERYIANVLQESHQTRASLEADIARVGLTWKDYFERMREEVQRIQLVNLLIRSRVNVSEEEVRREWETNPKYLESEKRTVAVIFIPVPFGDDGEQARAQAQAVLKEAKSDFDDAAEKYSKGPGAAEGGVLGDFEPGTMAPHYEKAMQGLGKGDVSDLVEGPGGLYIVKVVDMKNPKRVPFDDVKKEISDKLYEKRLAERYQKWSTEDLRKDHRVEIMVDQLALLIVSPPPSPTPAVPVEPVQAPGALPAAPAAPSALPSATPEAGAR